MTEGLILSDTKFNPATDDWKIHSLPFALAIGVVLGKNEITPKVTKVGKAIAYRVALLTKIQTDAFETLCRPIRILSVEVTHLGSTTKNRRIIPSRFTYIL